MGAEKPSDIYQKITSRPEATKEKPWESLPVWEMSLPQLAKCMQECEDWQRKDKVFFRSLWEVGWVWWTIEERIKDINTRFSQNYDTNQVTKLIPLNLLNLSEEWITERWNEINETDKETLLERDYTKVEYYATQLEFGKYRKKFQELLDWYFSIKKDYKSWKISRQEMENTITIYDTKWYTLWLKVVQEAKMIIAAELQLWSGIDSVGLELSPEEKNILINSRIKLIRWETWINVFVDGIYDFTLNDSNNDDAKDELIRYAKLYAPVKISTLIRLEVDQDISQDKNIVLDGSRAKLIKLPKKFAQHFEKAKNNWIHIQVENFDSPRDYIIGFYKGSRKVWELRFNDDNYLQSCYLLETHIDKSIQASKSNGPNKENFYERYWLTWKEYPQGMDIEEKIVEIMLLLDQSTSYYNSLTALVILASLPEELQIPIHLFHVILQKWFIYRIERYPNIAKHIVENPANIVYEVSDIPKLLSLQERDFDIVNNMQWVLDSILLAAIQQAPEEACENFSSIMHQYRKLYSLGTNSSIERFWNKTIIRYNLLRTIFDTKPWLRTSYPELFEEFSSLKIRADDSSSYDTILDWWNSWNLWDFTYAKQLPGTFDILRFIDDWIFKESKELKEKEKERYKIAIARNISLRFDMNTSVIAKEMVLRWKKLIEEEWKNINEARESISKEDIFKDKNTFHFIHWGQWKDEYWTKATIDGFTSKKWNGEYSILDGEEMNTLSNAEKNEKLAIFWQNFIESEKPATIILEWHANKGLFSLYLWSKSQDNSAAFFSDRDMINITPSDLAQMIILRNKWKSQNKKSQSKNDIILFSACEWDYIVNTYTQMLERNWEEFSWDFIPPIIVTGSEFWENTIYNPWADIPQQFFREVLMLKDPSLNPTIQTLFDNQDSKENLSNPTIFVPIFQDWKWIPKNLG